MKRNVRTRLLVGGTGAVAAAAIVATTLSTAAADPAESELSQAEAPESCEIEQLPLPEREANGRAWSVSPNGDYVGVQLDRDDNNPGARAALWHDDDIEVLDTPGIAAILRSVSDSGAAVGWWDDGVGFSRPFVYRDGEMIDEVPGFEQGSAEDINVHGDVVGKGPGFDRSPFLWPAGAEEAIELPLPDEAMGGEATGINDDGMIVGWWETADEVEHPYAWDADGDGIALPVPDDVDPDEPRVMVHRIVGDWASVNSSPPIRWNLSDGETVERLDEGFYGRGVNSHGWIVGNTDDDYPAMLADDALIEMPVLGDEPVSTTSPYALSDAGDLVVGQDVDTETEELVPVVWHCE